MIIARILVAYARARGSCDSVYAGDFGGLIAPRFDRENTLRADVHVFFFFFFFCLKLIKCTVFVHYVDFNFFLSVLLGYK